MALNSNQFLTTLDAALEKAKNDVIYKHRSVSATPSIDHEEEERLRVDEDSKNKHIKRS
ncbi:MAG: hypothetical protein GOMPHAMPRED_001070 [Gomphillus americanus]|uniref:Uncharacterized protein n=1 Tax=Gomphillus americanus TaxID=1940652 RepID=A0A8H3IK74_9LECA|nr:MAG: hypothetical protein GOMPHAMPRED_001070 [Gomphillus americanus]